MRLQAFTAVTLEPSELQTVTLELDPRAFARWSPERASWHIAADAFELHVGRSSRDIRLSARVNLIGDSATTQTATS